VAIAASVAVGCARGGPETPAAEQSQSTIPNPQRNAYFGDLHVHTQYSFDAFVFGVRAMPEDAYRFARGDAISHPSGYEIQLRGGQLDFIAVTDHSEYLGILPALADPEHPLSRLPIARVVSGDTGLSTRQAFETFGPSLLAGQIVPEIDDAEVNTSAWHEIIEAAERNYEPGRLTTFIGFEYTSLPAYQNLHRNVIYRSGAVPEIPFSAFDSQNPEDLWEWLDQRRADGMEALAIPHNSNASNGQMFKLETWAGEPLDADYAARRMRNEPIVEVTQVKGSSDTHPLLSPNDEWAEFEILPYMLGTTTPSEVPGSYAREALLNGLEMEVEGGFNPYRFGLIGSSDNHNAGGSFSETDYFGKVGVMDGEPQRRASVPLDSPGPDGEIYADTYYRFWGASGLAGVWAEENTRESIFNALRRKETFATTGPRIRVRFFAGYQITDALIDDPDLVTRAYAGGVPMGGDLTADGDRAPRFLAWAMRDPNSAPLQRLQIVKGWVEGGETAEQVFDIACSDGLAPDPETHRCPDNGATVDLSDCSIPDRLGAAELKALWIDPEPVSPAFYYLRVLENPTCRWSTWDAVRAGVEPRLELPKTIQERAWSSPIWFGTKMP
jgi:hypothetical protein